MNMLGRAFGIAEPVRRGMELRIAREGEWRPTALGPSAAVSSDILAGRDLEIGWEDVYAGEIWFLFCSGGGFCALFLSFSILFFLFWCLGGVVPRGHEADGIGFFRSSDSMVPDTFMIWWLMSESTVVLQVARREKAKGFMRRWRGG